MTNTQKTPISDSGTEQSLIRDSPVALGAVLRQAREGRGLRQQDLAARLGLRQRQISDLERAAMDPRLSTIQNVARALDLEVMLIPRHLIAVVEGLQRGGHSSSEPMYALQDEDDGSDFDTPVSKEPR